MSTQSEGKLTVYTTTWCPDCHAALRFLDEHKVIYTNIEIDRDEESAKFLEEKTGKRGVPYFILTDGQWVRGYIPGRGFDYEGMSKLLDLA